MRTLTALLSDNEQRCRLALEAAWEIQATVLNHLLPHLSADAGDRPIKAMLRRLVELSRIQMGAIDDDEETIESLTGRLHGD